MSIGYSGYNTSPLSASSIVNFTDDVRAQFTAGLNINIANGVINAIVTGSGGLSFVATANNITGSGIPGDPVGLKQNISLSSVTASFKGDGSQLTNLPLSAYATLDGVSASFTTPLQISSSITSALVPYATLAGVSASFTTPAQVTGAFSIVTASNAISSSYSTQAISSSFATTASYSVTASYAVSASWASVAGTAGVAGIKAGNVIVVDGVNGNDSTGIVNGLPFKTINAAINYVSSSGLSSPTIWVMPNTYTLTSGFTIPDNCALRGVSTQTTKLVLTGSGTETTMVTMGNNSRIEDVSLTLVSTSATTNLIGISLPGSTGTNSKFRTGILTVDNSSITASANTNVYGIYCKGTATISPSDFSFNFTRGVTVNVFSNGAGNKYGVYADSACVTTFRDTNIYVRQPTSLSSTGHYVGVVSENANCSLQLRTSSVFGPSTSGSYTGSDIYQITPGTGFIENGIQLGPGCDLINKTAGSKPFTTYVTPTTLVYQLQGNVQNGTYYYWQGVQSTADNTEVYYRFQQKSILQGMSANLRVSPGSSTGSHNVVVTVLKSTTGIPGSGVPTAMTASFTGGQTQANCYTTSVDFARGEYLAVQTTTPGNRGLAADLTIELDLF